MSLLTVGNPKLLKGQKKGYLSSVLHLAPANLSGKEDCGSFISLTKTPNLASKNFAVI